MKKLVSGCRWAHEKVLVSLRPGKMLGLSDAFVADLRGAGVNGVVSLLSKDQFRDAGAETLFGSLDDLSDGPLAPVHPRVNMAYVFWPPGDAVPTARQVRLTLDEIDEAHVVAGVAARRVGCRAFRPGAGCSDCNGYRGDQGEARARRRHPRRGAAFAKSRGNPPAAGDS